MAPTLLFDITGHDLNKPQFTTADIERVNPHRGNMRMLDAIVWADDGLTRALAYKDVRAEEFWVPGHIPGRPVFPGVLMIESAAQLASFLFLSRESDTRFMGFVGVDDVKFRGQVVPGDRLIILGHEIEFRPRRRCICAAQGVVNGTIVFEGQITGMPI